MPLGLLGVTRTIPRVWGYQHFRSVYFRKHTSFRSAWDNTESCLAFLRSSCGWNNMVQEGLPHLPLFPKWECSEKKPVTTCRDEDFLRRHPSLVELTDFTCIGFSVWNSSDFRVAAHSGVHDQFSHCDFSVLQRIGRQSLWKVDKRLSSWNARPRIHCWTSSIGGSSMAVRRGFNFSFINSFSQKNN